MIIEEPEMGLHPQAITVVMLVVFELLWRGYKVVISTHSPACARHRMGSSVVSTSTQRGGSCSRMRSEPKKRNPSARSLEHALAANYRVYFMEIDQTTRRVATRDISHLDPDAPNDNEASWGGLTGFSSRFGDAVRSAVNEDKR